MSVRSTSNILDENIWKFLDQEDSDYDRLDQVIYSSNGLSRESLQPARFGAFKTSIGSTNNLANSNEAIQLPTFSQRYRGSGLIGAESSKSRVPPEIYPEALYAKPKKTHKMAVSTSPQLSPIEDSGRWSGSLFRRYEKGSIVSSVNSQVVYNGNPRFFRTTLDDDGIEVAVNNSEENAGYFTEPFYSGIKEESFNDDPDLFALPMKQELEQKLKRNSDLFSSKIIIIILVVFLLITLALGLGLGLGLHKMPTNYTSSFSPPSMNSVSLGYRTMSSVNTITSGYTANKATTTPSTQTVSSYSSSVAGDSILQEPAVINNVSMLTNSSSLTTVTTEAAAAATTTTTTPYTITQSNMTLSFKPLNSVSSEMTLIVNSTVTSLTSNMVSYNTSSTLQPTSSNNNNMKTSMFYSTNTQQSRNNSVTKSVSLTMTTK